MIDTREVVRIARCLPIADPFDLGTLVAEVSGIVGVPVELAPYPPPTIAAARQLGEPLPAALCIATSSRFHVLYRTDTTASHQRHSILHEVGHLLCRHITPSADTDLRTVLRNTYDDAHERAAEAFAYEFERRLGRLHARRGGQPADERLTNTIGSILEG